MTQVFRFSNQGNENIFNVSVNGVAGVIEIPQGFYVGTTLAEALQERINQIEDSSGTVGGGITAKYNSATNNLHLLMVQQEENQQLKLEEHQNLDWIMWI